MAEILFRLYYQKYRNNKVKNRVLAVGECRYCGSTENLTIDHIFPLSLGGTDAEDNLQCLCMTCNKAKGSLTETEFFKLKGAPSDAD